jgi:hypothetical protein
MDASISPAALRQSLQSAQPPGMVLYDAHYAWCKEGKDEVHTWNPAAYR